MSAVSADPKGLIAVCPSCGQKNRLAYANLAKPVRCAKCRTALPPPGEPVDVPGAPAFEALITGSALPVLVDFWADWCGPCHMIAPEVRKVAARRAGRLVVAKVDTEALPDVASRWRIQSLPTLALFRAGRELGRTMGAQGVEQIDSFIAGQDV